MYVGYFYTLDIFFFLKKHSASMHHKPGTPRKLQNCRNTEFLWIKVKNPACLWFIITGILINTFDVLNDLITVFDKMQSSLFHKQWCKSLWIALVSEMFHTDLVWLQGHNAMFLPSTQSKSKNITEGFFCLFYVAIVLLLSQKYSFNLKRFLCFRVRKSTIDWIYFF